MYPLPTNPVYPSVWTNLSWHTEWSFSREDLTKGRTMAESFKSINFQNIPRLLLSSCTSISNKQCLQTSKEKVKFIFSTRICLRSRKIWASMKQENRRSISNQFWRWNCGDMGLRVAMTRTSWHDRRFDLCLEAYVLIYSNAILHSWNCASAYDLTHISLNLGRLSRTNQLHQRCSSRKMVYWRKSDDDGSSNYRLIPSNNSQWFPSTVIGLTLHHHSSILSVDCWELGWLCPYDSTFRPSLARTQAASDIILPLQQIPTCIGLRWLFRVQTQGSAVTPILPYSYTLEFDLQTWQYRDRFPIGRRRKIQDRFPAK